MTSGRASRIKNIQASNAQQQLSNGQAC